MFLALSAGFFIVNVEMNTVICQSDSSWLHLGWR